MPILRKNEVQKPTLPPEFQEHMGEAVRHQYLSKYHKGAYEGHRRELVDLVAASDTIVLEVGSSIGKDEGSLLGYLTAKSGDRKFHDLDAAYEAVKAGLVRLEDFFACIKDLDADAVARVFDGKDGRPTITTVKSGEPIYSITAYPDANAIFKAHKPEIDEVDAHLREVLFSAPKPVEAPAPVAAKPTVTTAAKPKRARKAA